MRIESQVTEIKMESHRRRLGEKLRKRREACGFETQGAFAEKLGVDQSRVSNWETGIHLPDRHYRLLIQKYLKVPDEFFGEDAYAAGNVGADSLLAYSPGDRSRRGCRPG